MYDYLLVGAGLFNAVFAYEASKRGKKCLVIDKRNHIGGNCYTKCVDSINVHMYGAHIFRTSERYIWDYINCFAEFNNFVNSPIARYKNELYNLPFNMNTFSKMWGITTPDEAEQIINNQRIKLERIPENLEEHALNLVGKDIYEKLIKGYTEKQWGRKCNELPASIMRRIPLRFTYDNNYYKDRFQGIPIGGFTPIIEKMFKGCDIELERNYLDNKEEFKKVAKKIIYTGAIDEYFDYKYGELEYRSLYFEHEKLDIDNYQGVAVVNYTGDEVPYTRIIEHKHFEYGTSTGTIITREYPVEWRKELEPYYPINDIKNTSKYEKYANEAKKDKNIIFAGRLGGYSYTDMQDTIKNALELSKNEERA